MRLLNARMARRLAALVIVCALMSQAACFGIFGGTTPTEKFARDNKAFQIGLQEANKILNACMDANLCKPDAVIASINVLSPVNDVSYDIIEEAIKYLQVGENGKETLVITEAGHLRLEALATSLFSVTQRAVNNLAIGIPEGQRAQISVALAGLLPIAIRLASLVHKFKQMKEPVPSLRSLANPKAEVIVLRAEMPAGTRGQWQAMLDHARLTRGQFQHSLIMAEVK